MSDAAIDLDYRLRAPLTPFHGAPPPAPAWFDEAMAKAPQRSLTSVEGAAIETLVWGERGRPGLLLVHGGRAHAEWWPHIAPFFARDRRVAALSLSGNGGSDWRDRYEVAQMAREMVAVARAAGLYDAGPPAFVAHSFGSRPLFNAAADPALTPGVAIVIDAAVSAPDAPDFTPPPAHPSAVYATQEAALARFRLMPPQLCDNAFILDYIARRSLKPAPLGEGDGGGEGWTWRFDPMVQTKFHGADRPASDAALRQARCPMAFLKGERSAIVRPGNLAYTRSIAPKGTIFAELPDAAHHVFLDQPLAFVDRLRDLLAELEG